MLTLSVVVMVVCVVGGGYCCRYSSDKSHLDEPHTMAMRADMEPLLYKYDINTALPNPSPCLMLTLSCWLPLCVSVPVRYGVNAVMAGHVHAYERSRPVVEGRAPVADGIVYFNIGVRQQDGGWGACLLKAWCL